MRILDRYIITSFLKNYLISFLVLVGMYVVLDMVFNFDELVEMRTGSDVTGIRLFGTFLMYVGEFYFYQAFLYFVHLSGIIPVVAAAFTLMRLIRFNELTALLSSGVPLLRVAAPIIIVGLLLNGLLIATQELLLPNLIPKLIRKHDHGKEGDTSSFSIHMLRDEQNNMLQASRYSPNHQPPLMEVIWIIQKDAELRPLAHIKADAAEWDQASGNWRLINGVIDRSLSGASAVNEPEPIAMFRTSITPEELLIYRRSQFVELLSTARINEMLERPRSYGQLDLLRVKHTRAAQLGVNMILLLLGLAAVLTREPRALKTAATRCVLLCGACMAVVFIAQQLAGQPAPWPHLAPHWPALMAWLPIFLFGPLAVWLLDRVET